MVLRNSNINNWEDPAVLGSYNRRSGTNTWQCWRSFTLFMNIWPCLLLSVIWLGIARLWFRIKSLKSLPLCLVSILVILSLHLRHSSGVNSVDICCLTKLARCFCWLPPLIRLWRAKYVLIIEPISVFLNWLLCLGRLRAVYDVLYVTSSGRWSLCRLICISLSIMGHYIYSVVPKICSWLSAEVLFILFSLLRLFPLMLWHPRLL